ncbi:hypothetical protein PoB_001134000 [Plakobranchus ocellatus]|uniref:Uncharacterized protein n=1 Tax=Plakobranchus ocellatus TaxID=259542 RepID=A0AAV3YQX1_9GAST|nr:hypothetical protein PoB_001134000 [Plakobranchus ocellatus]
MLTQKEGSGKTVVHVLSKCREVDGDCPCGWPDKLVNETLWCGDQVVMSTAAPPKSHAVNAGTRLRRLPQKKGGFHQPKKHSKVQTAQVFSF